MWEGVTFSQIYGRNSYDKNSTALGMSTVDGFSQGNLL